MATDWKPLSKFKVVYLIADNDAAGEKYVATVADQLRYNNRDVKILVVRFSGKPEGYDVADFLDEIGDVEPGVKKDKVRDLLRGATVYQPKWEPLPECPPKPEFNKELSLPGVAGEYCAKIAEGNGVALEFVSLLAMPIVTTMVQKKVSVRTGSNYTEALTFWSCVALESGNRKSSTLSMLREPSDELEREKREEAKIENLRIRARNDLLRSKVESLQKSLKKKENTPAKVSELIEERIALEAQIEDEGIVPQYWTADATTESLVKMMFENNGNAAIISDEGGIFDVLDGSRYSNGVANIDALNNAYNGSSVRMNRKSAESYHLESGHLSIAVAPQPPILKRVFNKPEFDLRGFNARFIFSLPKSNVGYRKKSKIQITESDKNRYSRLFLNLQSIPEETVLRFEGAAQDRFDQFIYEDIEPEMRPVGASAAIKKFVCKLPSHLARVAGIFHLLETDGVLRGEVISLETLERAIDFCQFLKKETGYVRDYFRLVEGDDGIVEWLSGNRGGYFTKSEFQKSMKSTLKGPNEIKDALKRLEASNYIKLVELQKSNSRPPEVYKINPSL